jgi:uncharacterized protein YukE
MAASGNGYKVSLSEASAAASELEGIIEELESQSKDMKSCQEEFLSDALWYGPKKTEFTSNFENYMQLVNQLVANGREYKAALDGMIADYQE